MSIVYIALRSQLECGAEAPASLSLVRLHAAFELVSTFAFRGPRKAGTFPVREK